MSKELNNVKFYVDWTAAETRANILPGTKVGEVQGEALATSMGKIAKWFTDIEATLFDPDAKLTDTNTTYAFTNGTDGSFTVTPSTNGTAETAVTVRVLPTATTSDENKVLMIDNAGAPQWTEQAWITKAENDLTYYYRKYNASTDNDKSATTYSAAEVDTLVNTIPKFAIKVVAALPSTDISTTTIYLVPNSGTGQNVYDEYIYVDHGESADPRYTWELIGTTEVDLTNYVKFDTTAGGDKDITTGDATSGVGSFKVKGEAVTVYGLGTAAGVDTVTTVDSSSTDTTVPTAKAVFDYVDAIDTGVSSVSGTANEIAVNATTGDVTVSLAVINTFDAGATSKAVGPTADVTGSEGQTIKVPALTVDTKGRVTAVGEYTLTTKDAKTAQTTITAGSDNFYPVLFGKTGVSGATSGAISTSDETDGVNKTGRLYVQVSNAGVTTLKADVFEGLAATQASTTADNTLASTAYVHNVLNSQVTGANGVTTAYDSTSKVLTVSGVAFTGADGTNAGTAGVVPAPTATDNTKFLKGDGTWTSIATTDTTYTLSGATAGTDANAGKLVITLTGSDTNTSTATLSPFTGATSSAAGVQGIVPAPASGDTGKLLQSDGTWTSALADGTTATTQAITDDSNKVATTAFVHDLLEDLIIHCVAAS